ncbi:hypothetical protein CHLRE_03g195500v5 [Chlamydomonas reinhardtii]|uniref:Patatin n=2 Tax=Chlamydomonas reinhardtii TaxID=3055 RepID=A0A2K3DYL8_CHLRE|nr:uncharacterized protein CHLRE_03g195500v5 [Chlamydomonas reinhardtii]PNW85631.1 hypothetical protein CHLRE_03g195500v5 [Chlamydomonas reinhardtii]
MSASARSLAAGARLLLPQTSIVRNAPSQFEHSASPLLLPSRAGFFRPDARTSARPSWLTGPASLWSSASSPNGSMDGEPTRSGTEDEPRGGGGGGSSGDEGSTEDKKRRAQARLEQVKRGLEAGTLGFGFSAGGFLYPYHLGVLWELHELDILKDYKVQMAGASAGSLAVATYNCGLEPEKATQALHEFAENCRANGTRYRLGGLLKDFLHAYLPDDAHERCRGNTHVALTRLFPVVRSELISEFESKDDFVNALLTSCHIPFYFNGSWMTEFRGRFYMDGGVAAFIPRPPTPHAVKVCCFPVNEVLATVQDRVAQYERVAALLDVAISPDASEPWPFSYPQMVSWALVPADDDMLRYMINKGRRDARAWAQRMELVPQDAAAGRTEGEGAGDVGGGAERGAARVAEAEERREAEGAAGGVEDTGARQGGEGGATARSEAEAEAVKQAAGGGKK